MAKLPPFFHVDKSYQYQRQPVKYVRRDDEYYHFIFVSGGKLSISPNYTHLIFEVRK